jgi:tRNA A-37 threonylcarbamoyl transferase component Bud32
MTQSDNARAARLGSRLSPAMRRTSSSREPGANLMAIDNGESNQSATRHQTASTSADQSDDRKPTDPLTPDPTAPNLATITEGHESGSGVVPPLTIFGRYVLLQEVAAGGMGVVYKARDTSLGRIVALKMIRSGTLARADEVERFHREARAAANLRHPNIIDIHEIGQHEGRYYFTMDFAEGGSLDQHLDRFSEGRAAAALVEKVARAVYYAHEHGVLHRDLKPANVLLDSGDEPRVCDFGLAKLADSEVELTQTGQFLGTPAYMAPEQAADDSGRISEATDVWALGVLLYQLLTGRRPFISPHRDALLRQIRTSDPPDPSSIRPGLDRSLEAIVLKCLHKDPAARYASAALLADDLSRWLHGQPTKERPPSRLRRWWKSAYRNPRRTVVGALAIVVLCALAAGIIVQIAEPPPRVLVDDQGAHESLQWIIGSERVTGLKSAGEPLTFGTTAVSAAELLAHVPWPSYRVEAEMRHDRAEGYSDVGLFVLDSAPTVDGPYPRSVLAVGFGDLGPATGDIQPALCRIDQADDESVETHAFHRLHHFTSAQQTGQPADFRKLALEVTPDEVRVFFEGERVGVLNREDIAYRATHLFRAFPDFQWKYEPQTGLGIMVTRGSATIRRLTVTRLPASDANLK